ncbi:MAG TPA: rhodanese-like domain-containing protein [Polyangiaceae bacterium]
MAAIKPVTPAEAAELMKQGSIYVDVRSEAEFEQGHPAGALNVPLLKNAPGGMAPNADFLTDMQAAFGTAEPLIVGCKAGGRSRRAAEMLVRAGFADVSDQVAGFDAGRDPFGKPLPGWSRANLPVEAGQPAGQSYPDVKARKPR